MSLIRESSHVKCKNEIINSDKDLISFEENVAQIDLDKNKIKEITYNPTIPLSVNNGLTFIKLTCAQAIKGYLNLIVDSGSNHSMVKLQALRPDTIYDPVNTSKLNGISGDRATLGSTMLNLKFGRKNVAVEFDLLDGPPPESDGLLGSNITHHSIINFPELKFTFIEKIEQDRMTNKIFARSDKNFHSIVSNEYEEKSFELSTEFWPKSTKINEGHFEECDKIDEDEDKINKFIKSLNKKSIKCMMIQDKNDEASRSDHPDRISKILDLVNIKHLNEETSGKVINIIKKYENVFKLEGESLPPANVEPIKLEFLSDKIINLKQYNLPKAYSEHAYKDALEWEKQGIVEESNSAFNHPVLVVKKQGLNADGSQKLRTCIDLRALNKTIKEKYYHLPQINNLIADLPKGSKFISVDLFASYLQFPVSKETSERLAFTLKHRRFQFKRLPFGMMLSGHLFAQELTKMLDKLLEKGKLVAYLDDILIIAETEEEALTTFEEMLAIFDKFNIKINPEKMSIFSSSIKFLGYIIEENGIRPPQSKTEAISRIPTPKNETEVKSFVAMTAFFRQFIPNHSEICEPLYKLIRKDVTFEWNNECEKSFNKLKQCLLDPPLLARPCELDDENAITVLMTDASNYGIGATLGVLKDEKFRPIAFASKLMNKAQRNYSVYEKEFLALMWAITEQFKYILLGRKKFFVLTDHKALVALIKSPIDHLENRPLRWRLKLENFNFKLIHINGELNPVADFLSRLRVEEEAEEKVETLLASNQTYAVLTRAKAKENKKEEQNVDDRDLIDLGIDDSAENALDLAISAIINTDAKDKELSDPDNDELEIESFEKHPNVRIIRKVQDPVRRHKLIKNFHEHILSGHLGQKRTYLRLSERFKWKGMYQEIENFVRNCEICQKVKNRVAIQKPPLGETDIPLIPFTRIYVDLAGHYPETVEGYKYIISFQDATTKFVISRPIRSKEANLIAEKFVNEVILIFGGVKEFYSDMGKEFNNQIMKKTLELLRIREKHSAIYAPQSNLVEKYNEFWKNYVRCFMEQSNIRDNWSNYTRLCAYAYNICPHSRTGKSSYELLFGRKAIDHISGLDLPIIYTYDTYFEQLFHNIKNANEASRTALKEYRKRARDVINKKAKEKKFITGEIVLVRNFTRKALEPKLEQAVIVEDVSKQSALVKRRGMVQLINKKDIFPFRREDKNKDDFQHRE